MLSTEAGAGMSQQAPDTDCSELQLEKIDELINCDDPTDLWTRLTELANAAAAAAQQLLSMTAAGTWK